MIERPILFSDAMVRAILDGRKTQTRRVVKQNLTPLAEGSHMHQFDHRGINYRTSARTCTAGAFSNLRQFCPFGNPGDRLWVRETWNEFPAWKGFFYAADDLSGGIGDFDDPDHIEPHDLKWRPSIHMPRAASRITLEVTGVRVERLQDISEADAKAEGAKKAQLDDLESPNYWRGFKWLWESTYGSESWDSNPWVWVVEFRRLP